VGKLRKERVPRMQQFALFQKKLKKGNFFSKKACNFVFVVIKYTGIWMKNVRTLSGAAFQLSFS
jgi:hypothetical protein